MTDAASVTDISQMPEQQAAKVSSFPFSLISFLQGLSIVIFVILLLIGWVFIRTDATMQKQQDKMATKTVLIQYEQKTDSATVSTFQTAKDALPEAPFEDMTEQGQFGPLPKIRDRDKMSPFHAYKKPFEAEIGIPRIAVVFFDVGLSRKALESILKSVPSHVTLSLSPYAKDLEQVGAIGRSTGHEIWLELPYELKDSDLQDNGPQAILRNTSLEQNQGRLAWTLAQITGYAGVVTPKGHVFHDDATVINPIINQIFDRGLGYVEMDSDGGTTIGVIAHEKKAPYGNGHIYIDEKLSAREVADKFKEAEDFALTTSKAIVFIRPTPLTIAVTKKWFESMEGKEFALSPLSAVLQ